VEYPSGGPLGSKKIHVGRVALPSAAGRAKVDLNVNTRIRFFSRNSLTDCVYAPARSSRKLAIVPGDDGFQVDFRASNR